MCYSHVGVVSLADGDAADDVVERADHGGVEAEERLGHEVDEDLVIGG